MPYDPVREAALASPVDHSLPLPFAKQPDASPSPFAQGLPSDDLRTPSTSSRPPERRSTSLAHILTTTDERPWTARSSSSNTPPSLHRESPLGLRPFSDDAPHRPIPLVPSSSISAPYHPYRSQPDLQPITLPPADHPNRNHHRDPPSAGGRYSPPPSSRLSLSPTATRSNSPIRTRSPEDILNFPHRPRPSLSPVAVREAEEMLFSYPHRPSRSPISTRGTPLTLSPVQSFRSIDDRPPTSQQPVIAPLLPSPPTRNASPPPHRPVPSSVQEIRKPIPYDPRRRTPASSVLVPLSPSEMELYRQSKNPLRTKELSSDPMSVTLPPSDESARGAKRRRASDDDDRSALKRSRDTNIVVEHYNARPNVNVHQRQESPIIGLKNFNNWIKSVIIAKWAVPALNDSPSGSSTAEYGARRHNRLRGRVLDLGCGKGGDLQKWHKSRAQLYVGVDIADTSIAQAKERAVSLRAVGNFVSIFYTLDCYSYPLSNVLERDILEKPFDVVSMQFCMHYAFETISKARMMLENVARYLRKGGRFIGTIPNASFLVEGLKNVPPDAKELSFGNPVYRITFENRQLCLFGQRYNFFLLDAVDDVPEYVVHWDNFVELAQEHGLHLLERKEFHEIFVDDRDHDQYGPLLKKMKVMDEEGNSQMDEDQWDAANIYVGFVFEKR